MTDNPEQIARGLTKAQREAIAAAKETLFGADRVIPLRNRWTTKVALNLEKRCLSEPANLSQHKLTPLGLAVRDIILREEGR